LIGNELFRARYQRFGFQITLFFIVLFSFLIFYIPVVLGKMGVFIFLLSGVTSLILATLFVHMVLRVAPVEKSRGKRVATLGIVIPFLIINVMYFTNIIPPIPLALQDAGVYYDIVRRGDGTYRVSGAETSFLDVFRRTKTIPLVSGDPLYFYSAVFAPTKLETIVAHRWQSYGEAKKMWVTASEIAFSISGGRGEGYRGYSTKTALFPGLWRVQVITERGQVVGQEKFVITPTTRIPELVVEIK